METGTEHRAPARAAAQSGDLADRGRAHRDHRHQGQSHAPARGEDDHPRQARRRGGAAAGRVLPDDPRGRDKLFDTISPRFRRPRGRLSAHHSRRLPQGRWRRNGVHRASRQREDPRREAPEARRTPRQARRRNPQGHGSRRSRNKPPAAEELPPPAKKRKSSGDKARADYPNSERIRLPDALFHCPLRLSRLRPAVHPVQCGGQLTIAPQSLFLE